jgi:hypothetical protein
VLCPTFFRTQIVEAGRGAATEKENARIIRWMERSKVQASGVAKAAIDSLEDGKLYVLPMQDGEVAWRMKREAPEMFYDSQSQAHEKYLEGRYKP